MYIYKGHRGSLYSSEEPLDDRDLYCETCGDYDWYIGCAETQEEILQMLCDDIAIPPGRGGWDYDYVLDLASECFPDERRIGRHKGKGIIYAARADAKKAVFP